MIEVRVRRIDWLKDDAVSAGKFEPSQIPSLVCLMKEQKISGYEPVGEALFDHNEVITHGLVVDSDQTYYEVITN